MSDMTIDKCKLDAQLKWNEVDVHLQKLDDAITTINDTLVQHSEKIEDTQELSTSVSVLANNMKQMLEEQQKQGVRIQTLEQKPAKRWDMVVDKIILLAVAAVVAYIATQVGL